MQSFFRTAVSATILALMSSAAGASSDDTQAVNAARYPAAGEVAPEFLSYNVEMASVIGGNFWRPYASMPKSAPAVPSAAPAASAEALLGDPKAMFMGRPPLNLADRRLRNLAAGLGPAHVRVSGTWANKIYFQQTGDPANVTAPPGFDGVLTRAQWRGVVDFIKAVNGKLLLSFTISPGVRDANGVWTSKQASDLMAFTKSSGGRIHSAEFFNEPNVPVLGGAPAGYSAADYGRDHAIFEKLVRPGTLVVGTSAADAGGMQMPAGLGSMISVTDLMGTSPRPQFDVFSYHHYPALSQRCAMMGAALQTNRENALSPAWFAKNDEVIEQHKRLRDVYAPGKPIWVTEIADAACGGNPWGPTFLETFRFADMLGRYSKHGVDAVFHNTLIGSEYGLIDEDAHAPTPKYWVALLWRRLMGVQSLDAGSQPDGSLLYAHCHRQIPGAVTLLAINTSVKARIVRTGARARVYALTAGELESRSVMLNGRTLALGANDRLPKLKGRNAAAGEIELAPHSVSFIELTGVRNPACS